MRSGVGGRSVCRRGDAARARTNSQPRDGITATGVAGGPAHGVGTGLSRAELLRSRRAPSPRRQQSGRIEPTAERSQAWQHVERRVHALCGALAPSETASESIAATIRVTANSL